MTQLKDVNNDKTVERKSLIGLVIIFGLLLGTAAYYFLIKSTSDYVYTIGTAYDYSVKPQSSHGMTIKYQFDERTYKFDCLTENCRMMKIGDKLLLKIYTDDPSVYDIIFDKKIDLNRTPPTKGWKSIEEIR